MKNIVEIVNLVSCSSLTQIQFKSFLQELDSEYADLPLHSNVCWLSQSNVLNKFVLCLEEEINIFLEEKHFPELNNEDWLFKLMFLTDISKYMNDLKLHLQRRDQTIFDYFEHWKEFLLKLDFFCLDIFNNTYKYFPSVEVYSKHFNVDRNELEKYIATLKEKFSNQGKDFETYSPIFSSLIKLT